MHADGSMTEDSVSYHRFVMEMLVVKTLLGDESEATKTALAGSALHLVKLGVLEGEIPQWGDWDEGRVLASSGSALDLAGSTARSEEHTSELQSLMRISYAVFCLKKQKEQE